MGLFARSLALSGALSLLAAVASNGGQAQSLGSANTSSEASEERTDPVFRLQSLIESGELELRFDSVTGYLPSLLEHLEIPVASQGLIFSRTSLQTDLISPWTPRAVYFNDDVYVGWVQESSFLEIASIDPDDGAVFYTLSQNPSGPPTFQREGTTCLMCHEARAVTGGVPGILIRSVLPDRYGYPISPMHEGATSDRTPLNQRWGGWYVTGTHGGPLHSGNGKAPVMSHEVTSGRKYAAEYEFSTEDNNVQSLEGRFDVEPYLSGHSDLVALMVLAHQGRVHNLITLAHRTYADALKDQRAALSISGESIAEGELLPSTRVRIDGVVERLVEAMLFSREAPLQGVTGTSGYAEEFAQLGPWDDKDRSLRDFDLDRRLFRYPMSFLIYSEAFQALPKPVLDRVYGRVVAVLSGEEDSDYAHLSTEDRKAIREILEQTLPGYPSGAP